MRVLYLMPQPKRPDRIGAYTFLDEEIQGLARAGVDTYVLSRQIDEDAMCGPVHLKAAALSRVPRAAVGGFLARHASQIPMRCLANPAGLYHVGRVEWLASRFVAEERIEVIHSHFAWPEGFGGLLTKAQTGRPLVASLRGTDIVIDQRVDHGRRREPAYDAAIHQLVGAVDRTICFSGHMRDHAVSLGVDPANARVVRKGVDLTHFRAVDEPCRQALKARLGLPPLPLILSVGGLTALKGVHVTLEALARIAPADSFTFVVCGEGPERSRLERLAQELGLAQSVRLPGNIDRTTITDFFSACDFLVHSSFSEAAGNVLLEAMASGRPVICARAGGPQEYVEDGVTGYVVDPGDVDALALRIDTLLRHPDTVAGFGAESLRRAHTVYSFDRMIQDIAAIYEEVLARR